MDDKTQRLIDAQKHPNRLPVMSQRWDDLLFLHWRVKPETIAPLIPAGLTLDTFEQQAYVGLVGFRMNSVRPSFLPPLPWLSYFLELNVRLYVLSENGEPGIYFLSLDCNRAPAVAIARKFFSIPYQHAEMKMTQDAEVISLTCRRRGQSDIAEYHWRPPAQVAPTVPGTLEHHLVERYNFFTPRNGQIYCGRVHHAPYRIGVPELLKSSSAPLIWDGLSSLTSPPLIAHHSPGVRIKAFPLTPISY